MSDSPLYDINTAYPFVWSAGVFPEELKEVRDMRVMVVLRSRPSWGTYSLRLTSLTSSGGTVNFTWGSHSYSLSVPLLTSGGAAVMSSFIAMDSAPETSWIGAMDIHPDCLVLLETPPEIQMEVTTKYYSDKTRETYTAEQVVDQNDPVLRFANGHNVTVTGERTADSVSLSFDCASENGLDIWKLQQPSPWADREIPTYRIKGLRDINGLTGDVRLLGDASVNIDTTVTAVDSSTNAVNLIITKRDDNTVTSGGEVES